MSKVIRNSFRFGRLFRNIWATDQIHFRRSLSAFSMTKINHKLLTDSELARHPLFLQPARNSMFGSFLDEAWNKVDKNRIKEIGPEVGAAEWIMRNGGSVKWANHAKWVKDYNQIGMGTGPNTKIEAIDATECSINASGFEYLKGLSGVKMVKFNKAHNVDNAALSKLSYIENTLTKLEIISCGNVSDSGIKGLSQLKNLKEIFLQDLPSVKDPEGCVRSLQSSLPGCNVSYST